MAQAGYEVLTASEGNEGIRLAREHQPDIILCDVMMPVINGFQLKEILSVDAATAEIPFIFLTARTAESDKLAGLKQGADDYITKPFNVEEVIARVAAILRRNELGRRSGLREMESRLDQVKRNISSNYAHELRTPLAIILSSLELAIREKGNGEDLDWYLNSCLVSATKLSMLVYDLILLNDIDQGSINKFRTQVDLDFHFQEPIRKVLETYANKKLTLEVSIDPEALVHAPEFEFDHVISHLVDNACKFSPPGAHIWVNLAQNGPGGCVVTVENEGSYIPPELRQKVFERFYQVQQGENRPYGGLGIGLTIARAVAEVCRGSVDILDSSVGCKVCLILPPAVVDWKPHVDA
jgi:signal transduction histidine kinase